MNSQQITPFSFFKAKLKELGKTLEIGLPLEYNLVRRKVQVRGQARSAISMSRQTREK